MNKPIKKILHLYNPIDPRQVDVIPNQAPKQDVEQTNLPDLSLGLNKD